MVGSLTVAVGKTATRLSTLSSPDLVSHCTFIQLPNDGVIGHASEAAAIGSDYLRDGNSRPGEEGSLGISD